jgi:hypothetical protein
MLESGCRIWHHRHNCGHKVTNPAREGAVFVDVEGKGRVPQPPDDDQSLDGRGRCETAMPTIYCGSVVFGAGATNCRICFTA